MDRVLPPTGAAFAPDAHLYHVHFKMKRGTDVLQPVTARGIVAAYNIAIMALPDVERDDILYCKSVTRIDHPEEI